VTEFGKPNLVSEPSESTSVSKSAPLKRPVADAPAKDEDDEAMDVNRDDADDDDDEDEADDSKGKYAEEEPEEILSAAAAVLKGSNAESSGRKKRKSKAQLEQEDEAEEDALEKRKTERKAERERIQAQREASKNDPERLPRTVFVGNVPCEVVKKQAYKEFKALFKKHGIVESIRFRSVVSFSFFFFSCFLFIF
jgi:nucleolar protein 12